MPVVQGKQLMPDIIRFESLENKLIILRDTLILIDKDVAELFGVDSIVMIDCFMGNKYGVIKNTITNKDI